MRRLCIHSFVRADRQIQSALEMALEKSAKHTKYSCPPRAGGWKNAAQAIADGFLSLVHGNWRDTQVDKDPPAAHAKPSIQFKWSAAERRHAVKIGI